MTSRVGMHQGASVGDTLSRLDLAILDMKRAKVDAAKVTEVDCGVESTQWNVLFCAPNMAWTLALIVDDFTTKESALLIQLLEQKRGEVANPGTKTLRMNSRRLHNRNSRKSRRTLSG